MWLKRCLAPFAAGKPVVFVCPLAAGPGTLIGALEEPDQPLVWCGFSAEDALEPLSQGRKLAGAVNRKLGHGLVPEGLTAAAVLETLDTSLSYLAPLTLAVSGAHHVPKLFPELLNLHHLGCRVVLHAEAWLDGVALPSEVQLVTTDQLRLELAEATELVDGRLPEAAVHLLYEEAFGLYERFMTALHRKLELPPYLVMTSEGPRPLSGHALEPDALLNLLIRKKRWLEALEVAVYSQPKRVPEVLAEAGHHYHAEGLHKRLYILLESLPEQVQAHETVRFWRLQAAFRLDRVEAQAAEVKAYLEHHEAPELRALYAGVLASPHETALTHAKRAYRAKRTAFTAFQFGRLIYAPEAIDILKESISLAEKRGYPYEAARNAGMLAEKLIWHGQYQEAAGWGQWALREMERHKIKDSQRRLRIVNDWTYARLLVGDTAGLEPLLREYEVHLAKAHPTFARLFRDTLGDYLIANFRPVEALHYYRLDFDTSARERFAEAALKMVRGQLELGQTADALATARQALEVTKDVSAEAQAPAHLAYGMVLALTHPVEARGPLQRARKLFFETYNAFLLAQAELYRAYTYVAAGDAAGVRAALGESYEVLGTLPPSALRLLSGPEEAFRPVWALWLGEGGPLELRFLGRKEVWWQGKRLELFPQWLEILAVLALKQRPLTLEALLAELYGDGGNKTTLKASLSKLRQVLPVSPHPYQLEVAAQADFVDVLESLRQGDLQGAIRLYRGPLLPDSEVPCIREHDEMLSESLRRAALDQRDLESLLRLSEVFPDDLELLEDVSALLEAGDPRVPLVRTRLGQVQRGWLGVEYKKEGSG
jgi:hypothetical protein